MNSPVKTGNMVNSDGDAYIDSSNALNNQPARSGNFINGEGTIENLVDILISKASSAPTPLYTDDNNTLNTQPAISGNMVDSNNEVYNIVDLIKDGGGGGGTVDQTYDSTSANAQSGIAIAGAGFLTSTALSGYATETWVSNQSYQLTSNIATTLTSTLTDSQYPSAKLFYDTCGDIETLINAL